MAAPVAYVPINNSKIPDSQAPTKIDTPQYPDKGVSYAGYSKTPLSGNQFRLNPQEILNYTFSDTNKVNVLVSESCGFPENDKTLYITSMQIHTSVPAVTAGSYIQLSSYPKVIYKQELVRSETVHIVFPTPLVCSAQYSSSVTPSGLELKYSTGAGGTINSISVNLQGWTE